MDGNRQSVMELFAYLVIGGGVGWLAGLSTAPVIAIIITSLVGSISALVAGAAGLQGASQRTGIFEVTRFRVNPAPLALLVTGLLAGSSLGIVARSHNLLGVGLEAQIRVWTDLGLDRAEVVQRYFSSTGGTTPAAPAPTSLLDTVLFSSDGAECVRLLAMEPSEIGGALERSSDLSLRALLEIRGLDVGPNVKPFALYGALTVACNFDVRTRVR